MKRVGTALITAAAMLCAAGCKRPSEPILPDEAVAPAIATVAETAAPAPTATVGGVRVDAPPPEAAEPEPAEEADLEDLVPAPPEPIVESPGPAPSPDHHWVEGYWRWDTSHYVWEPGYWVDADDGAPFGPPAEPAEDAGPTPVGGYVFMPGYWRWSDGAYLWMGGHWAPPRNGFDYVRPRWKRNDTGRWSSQGGYWVPKSGVTRDDYQPAHPTASEPVHTPPPSGPKPRAPSIEGGTGEQRASTYGEAGGHSLYGDARVDLRGPPMEPRAEERESRLTPQPRAPAGRGSPGRSGGPRHGRR
jgi:WXXGXW repeat (2 copies)